MPRPPKPVLSGIYRSPDNRFSWDPAVNPSPMRCASAGLQRQTEGLPVLCKWCGEPYWPPMHITEGCCSEACTEAEQTYLRERKDREALFDELRDAEVENNRLRGLMGRATVS